MLKKQYIIIIPLLLIIACNKSEAVQKVEDKKIVPKVLKESDSSWDLSSLRYTDNILESIYKEISKDDDELKELHQNIDDIYNNKNALTQDFNRYNQKNISYYSSANSIINELDNEKLKELLTEVIKSSESSYNREIKALLDESNTLDNEIADLNDYIKTLKVIKTIDFIESYQKSEKSDIELIIELKNRIIKAKEKILSILE